LSSIWYICLTTGKNQDPPIHKKGDKTERYNYQGISLLRTSYKVVSNILLSRLIPYADEIIGDHQCGFECSRSMTDQIIYMSDTGKMWKYNGKVHKLFVHFKELGGKYYTIF
jgi:hypothetical protein